MRLVSLVPSSTETLLALGAEVIACTRFCEQPAVPTVGGTKNPDIAAIVALAPDLVVMDAEENRVEDRDELVAAGLAVHATDVCSIADAEQAVASLAAAAGIEQHVPWELPPTPQRRRTAVVPIWRRPWMLLGSATYGASVLDHLGVDVLAPPGRYPTVDLDEVIASVGPAIDAVRGTGADRFAAELRHGDVSAATQPKQTDRNDWSARLLGHSPDLVIVPSEPYAFKPSHLGWLRTAFATSTVVEVDGQDLFWWGIRTPAAVGRLAGVLA